MCIGYSTNRPLAIDTRVFRLVFRQVKIKMIHRRCKVCQKFFIPLRTTQIMCSDKCRAKYKYYRRKPVLHKLCKQCGKELRTRLKFQLFCCDKCKLKYHTELLNRQVHYRECKYCGATFTTTDTRQIYCGKECRYSAKLIRENKRYKGILK